MREARAVLALVLLVACGDTPGARCDLGVSLDAARCAEVHAMTRSFVPPPSPTNRVADDPRAVHLGFAIFFDARFSANSNVRCASCHDPDFAFQDTRATGTGIATVARNTQGLHDVAFQRTFFWDGRADTLWSQAIGPLLSADEMGMTRLGIAHRIARSYTVPYEAVFGGLPPLDDLARFPAEGSPGDAAYDAMTGADKLAIDTIVANVGKAIEAYERKLVSGPSAFDLFLDGDASALGRSARRGLVRFVELGCARCHGGPMLADDAFHNLGLAADTVEGEGRARGIERWMEDPFNARGAFSDARDTTTEETVTPDDLGAYRTPSLRGVADTAPYGHDGRFGTLEDAIRAHAGRDASSVSSVGVVDPMVFGPPLADADVASIVAFLESVGGSQPPLPYSDWPDR